MSIRDLSSKRLVRHVDNLSTIVHFSVNNIAGLGLPHKYGFIVKATTKPILILGCDIRYFGGTNQVVRGFGTIADSLYDSLNSTASRYSDYTGKNPLPGSVVVKGGYLANYGYFQTDFYSLDTPEMPSTQYQLARKFAGQMGQLRTGGYLVQPNTTVTHISYMQNAPLVHTDGSGILVEGCLEYIEGDYDYTEFFQNGMQPFNY